ncbi:MAG: hypothetical protein ACRDRU_08315, partial [Pseudonocardiaceae bacterium]
GMPAGEVIGEVVIEDPGADLQHLVELSEGDVTRGRGDPYLAAEDHRAPAVDLPRFWSVSYYRGVVSNQTFHTLDHYL